MKKIICVAMACVLALSSVLVLSSCSADKLEYELSEDGTYYIVVDTVNAKGDLVIPDTYKDLPVKEIDDSAFSSNSYLTSIVFPESIEKIGSNAFSLCSSLESITIGKNVKELEDYVFNQANALKEINYCGTPEQWEALCRYTTYTAPSGEKKRTSKVADSLDGVKINYNCTMPSN